MSNGTPYLLRLTQYDDNEPDRAEQDPEERSESAPSPLRFLKHRPKDAKHHGREDRANKDRAKELVLSHAVLMTRLRTRQWEL